MAELSSSSRGLAGLAPPSVVVVPQNLTLQEQTAVAVLIEEIQKLTQLRLAVQTAMPPSGTPAIVV